MDNPKIVNVTINLESLKDWTMSYYHFFEVDKDGKFINPGVCESYIKIDNIGLEKTIENMESYKDINVFVGFKKCKLGECVYVAKDITQYLIGGYQQKNENPFKFI